MTERRRMLLPAIIALIVGAAAPHATVAQTVEPSGNGEVERGRLLAERMCAICHLNPGQGEKTAASSIPGFAAVANRSGQTIESIVAWLASVPPMMPNHRLSADEREALAAYILSLAIPNAQDLTGAAPESTPASGSNVAPERNAAKPRR